MSDQPEVLYGGVANAGAVLRIGDQVERPANPNSATIHALLRHVRAHGFTGASEPVSIDAGRERVVYVDGEVPLPPYPAWAQSDEALESVTRLLRGWHDASTGFNVGPDVQDAGWSPEMCDGEPGDHPVICHNDVCVENVVFRGGRAVALLDFDFAAPGRRAFDVAAFARMCVPVDDDVSATNLGWAAADLPRRLRLVADTYGFDGVGREEVVRCLDASIARGGEFVLRHVEACEPGFVEMWNSMGGMARFDRRRAWWSDARPAFTAAML